MLKKIKRINAKIIKINTYKQPNRLKRLIIFFNKHSHNVKFCTKCGKFFKANTISNDIMEEFDLIGALNNYEKIEYNVDDVFKRNICLNCINETLNSWEIEIRNIA